MQGVHLMSHYVKQVTLFRQLKRRNNKQFYQQTQTIKVQTYVQNIVLP